MKKFFILLASVLSVATCAYPQTVLLDYDFDNGDRSGIAFYDIDGLTPTSFMKSIGFKVGTPWNLLKDSNTSPNSFLGSTSQYSPAGQANDWMVMPGVNIPTDGFVLRWKSQSFDASKRDGLKIFISTAGQEYASFPSEPVWQIEEEEAGATENFDGEFIDHKLPLDAYIGKTIYVAFVNQSTDKSIIAVDEIWLGRNDAFSIKLTGANQVEEASSFSPSGEICNVALDLLQNVSLTLTYGETTITENLENLNLAAGETSAFTMQHQIPLTLNEKITYTVTAHIEGYHDCFSTSSIVSTLPHKIVIEDHTGLWCDNCPAGLWAIDSLKTAHPNNIVPIAVHNGSALAVSTYDNGLSVKGLTSYPSGWVNRTYIAHPWGNGQYSFDDAYSWVSLYDSCRAAIPVAAIDVTGYISNEGTEIWATASVKSIVSQENADWRVVFVLTEDSVTGFYQRNKFAGSKYYVGGWEKQPISAGVPLNDIARGIYPSFSGTKGSLPAHIVANEPMAYSYGITVPETIQNLHKLNIAAMIVDGKTGMVVNADINPVEKAPAAVKGLASDNWDIKTIVANNFVTIHIPQATDFYAELMTIDGKIIGCCQAKQTAVISTSGHKGIALLRVASGNNVAVRKIAIR